MFYREKRRKIMKIRLALLTVAFFLLCQPFAQAQEYGKIRAMQQRANFIINQKNDFVARVLTSYNIPYELNSQGVVVRINMEGEWFNIKTIEIVPILREAADNRRQVAAHELYFYTAHGILDLVSELIIK
jgi:hypothetical protein